MTGERVDLTNPDLPTVRVWEELPDAWYLAGFVDRCEELKFEPTFLDIGSWSLTTDQDDQAAELQQDRLATVDWRAYWTTWDIVPSPSEDDSDDGTGQPILEVDGVSAFARLGWTEAWPDPTADINSQPVIADTDPPPLKGPAETVIKAVLQANLVDRYGMNLVIPPDQGRGGPVTFRPQFQKLSDAIPLLAKTGGLGVDIGLVPDSPDGTRAQLTLLVWEPEDLTDDVILTAAAGTIAGWKLTPQPPTLTKAIVNGAGTGGVDRIRKIVTTPESEAAAQAWSGHREGSIDGPDSFDPDELDQAGREALVAGAATGALELTAAEAEGLQAFTDYRPGVKATGMPATGVPWVDVLTSVPVDVSIDGVTVSAVLGNPSATDPDVDLADRINVLQTALRRLSRRS